jgi:hypothetical protein
MYLAPANTNYVNYQFIKLASLFTVLPLIMV